MEKILNDEEKIRRAEEIYFRRNGHEDLIRKKLDKKNINVKHKILLNLLIMFNLTILVFCVQNKDYIFTKEFIGKIDEYNSNASGKILNVFDSFFREEEKEELDYKMEENETNEKNSETILEKTNIIVENSDNPNELKNTISSMNEMEMDIKNLKVAYKFVNPLNGTVSSGFGARESKYQNVTGYHTGVDIAANSGTPIFASMQGIVELVSGEGDYGKHVKIRCNNVYTLYAHCSKIFVEEGQIVAEGQKIASVGSTGNSTGPHLHFEIRVEDRFVDPTKIINFKKKV